MKRPTITAVLNAHREGLIAKPSLESLKRSVLKARDHGFATAILVILDRSDQLTRNVVESQNKGDFRVIETDFGDPGEARNFAVEEAKSNYVGFLDADDLWGSNWLCDAAYIAETRNEPIIWHPEVCIYFGAAKHIFCHVDMEDVAFRPTGLAIENYWTALSFASKEIYADNPYPTTDLNAGFGFEDWSWNMETISRGIIHKIVPKTGHAVRRKAESVSTTTVHARGRTRPNDYMRALLMKRLKSLESPTFWID